MRLLPFVPAVAALRLATVRVAFFLIVALLAAGAVAGACAVVAGAGAAAGAAAPAAHSGVG